MSSDFNSIRPQYAGDPKPGNTETVTKNAVTLPNETAATDSVKSFAPEESTHRKAAVGLNHALEDINSHVQSLQRELKFSEDDSTGETVIQVLDSKSNEVIRQFPPEYVLKLAQSLQDAQGNIGSIFNDKA